MTTRIGKKSFFFLACALILGIVVAIILSEIAVRSFGLAPGLNRVATHIHRLSNNPELKYELVPYSYKGYEAINGQGRRDFHYPRAKSEDTFRIAVLGDSVTFGWGTNVWRAHPNMTEYYLNDYQTEGKTNYEIWNFGVRGYGIDEEVACLKAKVLDTNPDMVVLAYNLNDPDPFSVDLAWVYSEMKWEDEQYLHEMRRAWGNKIRRVLYEKSELYRLIRYRLLAAKRERELKQATNLDGEKVVAFEKKHNYKDKKERYFYEITEAYWDTVAGSLADYAQTCKANNIHCAMVVFPGLDDLTEYRYLPIHDRLKAEAAKNGLAYYDLLPVFSKAARQHPDVDIAIDFDHPNTEGQRLAGWAIANYLIWTGMLPGEAADYNQALFDMEAAFAWPRLEYFHRYDMFHLELGLNHVSWEDYGKAAEYFGKALLVNPENELAKKCLLDLYHKPLDDSIKAKIEKLLR